MSTIDPLEARIRRDEARLGSPGALIGVVIGLSLIVIGAAIEVRALFGFAEFDSAPTTDEPPIAIFGMVVGLPLLLAGMFTHLGSSRRYTGKLLASPGVGALPMLFVGFAIGAWWGVLSLTDPGALWMLPVGLSVVAALLLLLGAVVRLRRRGRRDVLAHLATSGRIVEGTIVEIPEIDPSSGGLLGPVTVSFTDLDGITRWVTKTGQWRRRDLPATGDGATVLYDPASPSDTSRIWVAPVGSSTAADFTRWHA